MNIENIDLLNLHDSDLISICIQTTVDGDENIVLHLNYLNDYESFLTAPKVLIFEKCWGAKCSLNFRVQGPDSIDSAIETVESIWIEEIRERYGRMAIIANGPLRHFVIRTSTTGSELSIVAERLRLSDP